jgi:AcrR family transcriptional regulator
MTLSDRVQQKSRRRRADEQQELRQAILAAAGELLLERGYEGFSMRRLAARIGYTATTLYLYFENKEDLLFTLLDDGYREFGERLAGAAATTDDPLERLERIGRAYIRFGLENTVHYQLMFMRRSDFLWSRLAAREHDHVDSLQVLQGAVRSALLAGVLQPAPAEVLALSLWAIVHGVVALFIAAPPFPPEFVEQVMEQTLHSMLQGIRA